MNRQELEHIVQAAAGIASQNEFIIVGSQSRMNSMRAMLPNFATPPPGRSDADSRPAFGTSAKPSPCAA